MIINKCDICGKTVKYLDSVILYSKNIDYCTKCKEKADNIKKEYEDQVKYENILLNERLKSKERNIIAKIKRESKKEGTNDRERS